MKTFKVIRLICPETVRVLKLKSYLFKDLKGHYCNHKKVPLKLQVPVSVGSWKLLVSETSLWPHFLLFVKLQTSNNQPRFQRSSCKNILSIISETTNINGPTDSTGIIF
jgi:hypothetical protein